MHFASTNSTNPEGKLLSTNSWESVAGKAWWECENTVLPPVVGWLCGWEPKTWEYEGLGGFIGENKIVLKWTHAVQTLVQGSAVIEIGNTYPHWSSFLLKILVNVKSLVSTNRKNWFPAPLPQPVPLYLYLYLVVLHIIIQVKILIPTCEKATGWSEFVVHLWNHLILSLKHVKQRNYIHEFLKMLEIELPSKNTVKYIKDFLN